jgi:tetratricopeptide (TPR) repeat protein
MVFGLCILAATGMSQDAPPAFELANRLYDQGKFAEAAASYQNLIQSGTISPAVYFNLGNALFKSGQIGRAVAVYRTLEASRPRDPDLRANLRFALAQVKGPSVKPSPVENALRRFTINEWAIAAAGGLWATFLLLAARRIRPAFERGLRPWIAGCGLLTLFCGGCLAASLVNASRPRAIVIVPEATVRQAPIEDAAALFSVSDGAELLILDRNQDWAQVTSDPRRTGWVKSGQLLSAR